MPGIKAHAISSGSNEQVFELLGDELKSRLPPRSDLDFVREMRKLPPGLRAMAATYELDVSLSLDDLGWHFGNWHDEELAEETAAGLEELEALELAALFREAFGHAKTFWAELGSPNWMDWYHGSQLEKAVMPLNETAWSVLRPRWNGIFSYWVEYAKRYPEKVGAKYDA